MAEERSKLRDYSLLFERRFGWTQSSGLVWVVIKDPELLDADSIFGPNDDQDSLQTRHLAAWPVSFLVKGQVNTWDYVNDVCNVLADRPGRVYVSAAEGAEAVGGIPAAGTYYFKADDGSIPSFSDGPDGSRRFIPPDQPTGIPPDETGSGISGSNTSGSEPDKLFRLYVSLRDLGCIVTKTGAPFCEASHLIPKKRIDIYRQVLGVPNGFPVNTFAPEYGICLRQDLHYLFDSFAISFYVQDDETLVLHVFVASATDARLHGKVIKRSELQSADPDFRELYTPPVWDCFRWHYQQAVKMFVRGFAWGVRRDTIPARLARTAASSSSSSAAVRESAPGPGP